jgi:hypothetical protein
MGHPSSLSALAALEREVKMIWRNHRPSCGRVAALLDVGNAFSSDFDPRELRVSVGAALRLDAVFGYFAGGAFDLGYAYGLSQGGGSETWLLFTHMI